jgi:hypothetical protein
VYLSNVKNIIALVLVAFCVAFNTIVAAQADSSNVVVFKDPRLDLLSKRPAMIAALVEMIAKANTAETAKKKVEAPTVGSEIKIGEKRVTGSIVTRDGFRVIIYNGNDRTKAMATKNAFMRAYPSIKSYMGYNTPNFKIKVGDFENKKDAADFMKKIVAYFPSSFLTPDQVTIKNIVVK